MPGNIHSIPVAVIASWPKPNYIDPVRRTWMPAYAGTLQVVASLMIITRLWLRAQRKAGVLGADDALLVPAWLSSIVLTVYTILSCTRWGVDRHVWDNRMENYTLSAKAAWLSEFWFLITSGCTKISVLLFYRRLVEGTYSKRWKYATWGAIAFTIAYVLAFILVLCFNCKPLDAYWKSYDLTYSVDYTCVDTRTLNPLSGALSVISDFYSVLLPCLMLRHFDAPKRQKVALNVVFSLGMLVVGAGAVRTYYLDRLGRSWDITWVGYKVYIWSTLEIELALICASAPALRVFFRRYLSDPLQRAINYGTAHSGSGIRSRNRDSKLVESNPPTYNHSRGVSYTSQDPLTDNKQLIKPSLETVDEREITASPSTTTSEQYLIKTPADFEAYAMQNLQQNRPPPRRPTYTRPDSGGGMQASLSQPFTDWYSPPTWPPRNGNGYDYS